MFGLGIYVGRSSVGSIGPDTRLNETKVVAFSDAPDKSGRAGDLLPAPKFGSNEIDLTKFYDKKVEFKQGSIGRFFPATGYPVSVEHVIGIQECTIQELEPIRDGQPGYWSSAGSVSGFQPTRTWIEGNNITGFRPNGKTYYISGFPTNNLADGDDFNSSGIWKYIGTRYYKSKNIHEIRFVGSILKELGHTLP